MKKIMFTLNSFGIGGIEKSAVILMNYLSQKGYEITAVVEEKKGIYLKQLDEKINIIEYTPINSSNILKRKFLNMIKRISFILKYKNKFDFSASFATYSLMGSFVARTASKNSALWGHADYMEMYGNKEEMRSFFEKLNYNKFKHVIFVSKKGRKSFVELFPNMKEKTFECNNLIDGKKIEELAIEKIEYSRDESKFTFLNVGRHDEKQKQLMRIIEASKMLKEEGMRFEILFVGDGQDSKLYLDYIKKNELEDVIKIIGRKENPYPYFNIADCILLSSDYEGYPVVFLESFILNKPIITTKVSGSESIEGKYGYVVEKNKEDIYKKMKKMMQEGYQIKEKFHYEEYNNLILEKLEKIF